MKSVEYSMKAAAVEICVHHHLLDLYNQVPDDKKTEAEKGPGPPPLAGGSWKGMQPFKPPKLSDEICKNGYNEQAVADIDISILSGRR